jgi:hypothetical protein
MHIDLQTSYINPNCFFEMCQNCQHSNFCYDCIIAKPFKKCPVCQVDVQGWFYCSQTNSRGEVTSPFKNSKEQVHLAKDFKSQTFKGLSLVVAFDNKIMPKLDFDQKRNKVSIKIQKSPKTNMELCGIKKGDFDFKVEKTFEDEDTKLTLVHFPSWELLPRHVKNVEYTYGSDSTCS